MEFLWWLGGEESACNSGKARDMGSITLVERFPGEANGKWLQYSC